MLQVLRDFAQDQLDETRELADLRNRHLDFFLALAEEAEGHYETPAQLVWCDRVDNDQDNLRAALAWSQQAPGRGEDGMRLAGALWRFWQVRGSNLEAIRWLRMLLD